MRTKFPRVELIYKLGVMLFELRVCAKADQETVVAKEITVDGVNIGNMESYLFQSPLFDLTFTENKAAGVAPQTAKAVSDG
jgi:hypothetical protein